MWGISVLMVLGFVLVVVSLALVVFGPEVGGYVQRLTGLPEAFLSLWDTLRWATAFLAVTLAHAVLYYLAPNAKVPFKWITPGGFAATVLILVSSVGLDLWVSNLGRYDQIYGQVGAIAIMVLMLWLYVTGLMVLIEAEMNVVLARMAEDEAHEMAHECAYGLAKRAYRVPETTYATRGKGVSKKTMAPEVGRRRHRLRIRGAMYV